MANFYSDLLNHRASNKTNADKKATHYIWHTKGDGKVRQSHAKRDGKIFAYSNPPKGGHPGEAYGCRCWAEPAPIPARKPNCDVKKQAYEEAKKIHKALLQEIEDTAKQIQKSQQQHNNFVKETQQRLAKSLFFTILQDIPLKLVKGLFTLSEKSGAKQNEDFRTVFEKSLNEISQSKSQIEIKDQKLYDYYAVRLQESKENLSRAEESYENCMESVS